MISRESQEYIPQLYESPAFGASGFFDLEGLRQGMATRREPTNTAIRCIRTKIDDIPCEWVLAGGGGGGVGRGYRHGGGFGWG